MKMLFLSTWESWSPREYFHCIQWYGWGCPFKDPSIHLSLSLHWQGWLCWPRHRTLHLVQSPVPVKTGWWTLWEQLWEGGFGVTDGQKTVHEPAMYTHRSRKPTCAAWKETIAIRFGIQSFEWWICSACTEISTCQLLPCYLHNESA